MRLFAVRQVWDALTGDELFELKHRKIVRAADWSADSAHIVTGGKEGVLRLYDVSRPEAEPSMLEGHAPNSRERERETDSQDGASGRPTRSGRREVRDRRNTARRWHQRRPLLSIRPPPSSMSSGTSSAV